MEKLSQKLDALLPVADAIESYAEEHLFDGFGLMMSAVDVRTGRPFDREFITEDKVPRRALVDPWAFWTYEDSIMTAGHYIDGLVIRYELTGDAAALRRAREVWSACRDVYYQSQVHGARGCFLRPYGGFDVMERFNEPLGTDQAAPLLCGVYRLMRHVDRQARDEMSEVMIKTLAWYADQGYRYRYYKSFTVGWNPPLHHQASFWLPAVAFAARETGEERWRRDLEFRLHRQLNAKGFVGGPDGRGIAWGFKQGGLLVLKDLLGPRFDAEFTDDKIRSMHEEVKERLAAYDEPKMLKRIHPESKKPGFKPYIREGFDRYQGFGWKHHFCIHAGRERPRHEITMLCHLAALGWEGAPERASDLLSLRNRVPDDFTHIVSEDHDKLQEEVQLRARSVGAIMLDWWRNYWLLRSICLEGRGATGVRA